MITLSKIFKKRKSKESLDRLVPVGDVGKSMEVRKNNIPDMFHAVDTETKFTELDVKLVSTEKKIDRLDAYLSTTKSELDELHKKLTEHDDNIQKLLSVYEVVSEKFNPFAEKESLLYNVSEKEKFIEEKEKMYKELAEIIVSTFKTLILQIKLLDIDIRPLLRYLPPKDVKELIGGIGG